ncbi:hypothetical protein [Rossellomorea marisflavi]|uniref:hypothetical protein n=1 Tax=Rossellomorea marisflavi TaxID=189381 RepID=UPI003F9EFBD8
MHPFHMDWFLKEEEKRENLRKSNEISLLNQQLSRLIKRLSGFVSLEDYEEEAMEFSRQLVQSSIWSLGYRNNFENPRVLSLQAGWITLVLKREENTDTIPCSREIAREFSQVLHRMRFVSQSAYMDSLNHYPEVRTYL